MMIDKNKYFLPSQKDYTDCAKQLLNCLIQLNLFDYDVYKAFENALENGSIWITSDTWLCDSKLDGFWRFELTVSKKSVKNLKKLPENVVRYLAQQLLAQTGHSVSRVYTIQELYTKTHLDEDKAILGYLLTRDVKRYSLI